MTDEDGSEIGGEPRAFVLWFEDYDGKRGFGEFSEEEQNYIRSMHGFVREAEDGALTFTEGARKLLKKIRESSAAEPVEP